MLCGCFGSSGETDLGESWWIGFQSKILGVEKCSGGFGLLVGGSGVSKVPGREVEDKSGVSFLQVCWRALVAEERAWSMSPSSLSKITGLWLL